MSDGLAPPRSVDLYGPCTACGRMISGQECGVVDREGTWHYEHWPRRQGARLAYEPEPKGEPPCAKPT